MSFSFQGFCSKCDSLKILSHWHRCGWLCDDCDMKEKTKITKAIEKQTLRVVGLCDECYTEKPLPHFRDGKAFCESCFLRIYQIPLPLDGGELQPDASDDSKLALSSQVSHNVAGGYFMNETATQTAPETAQSNDPMIEWREKRRRELDELTKRESAFTITEKEVLEKFQITKRTLERYRKDGYKGLKIEAVKRRDSSTGWQAANFYHPEQIAELERLRTQETFAPAALPPETMNNTQLEPAAAGAPNAAAALTAFFENFAPVGDNEKTELEKLNLLLTLNCKQAAKLTGLTEGFLLTACKAGSIKAFKAGQSHEWRFTRSALASFLDAL